MERPIIKVLSKITTVSIILMLLFTSCYYDNEECLYPEGSTPCDTVNISYSKHIWPIINDYCISCHSGGTPSGNIALENYDDINKAAMIPEGSYGSLFGVINHSPGNSPMPENGGKLSDCNIDQVRIWIDLGAPEN